MNNFEYFTEITLNNASYIAGAIKAQFAPYKEVEDFEFMYIMAEYLDSYKESKYRIQEIEFRERNPEF